MNVNGEYRIQAPRKRVWEALHDPGTLNACIPGCEEMRQSGDNEYEGSLTAQVGAVTTAFAGRLILSDQTYPSAWSMAAQMRSASAGWADGHATVTLTEDAGATVVGYRARIEPGGRLASVGGRLLHGVATRMANEFFARLADQLHPPSVASEPQELAEPVGERAPPLRVTPLAPTAAPESAEPAAAAAHPPEENPLLAFREPTQAAKNRILAIGAVLWLVIFACLFWPLG